MSAERVEDFLFNCPACTGVLVTDELHLNLPAYCSHCQQDITVPDGLAPLEKAHKPGIRRVMARLPNGVETGAKLKVPRVKPPVLDRGKRGDLDQKSSALSASRSSEVLEAELEKLNAAYADGQKDLEQLRVDLKESKMREGAMTARAEQAEKDVEGLRQALRQREIAEAATLAQLDKRFKALQAQVESSGQRLADREAQEVKLKVALGRLQSGALEVLRFISDGQRGAAVEPTSKSEVPGSSLPVASR